MHCEHVLCSRDHTINTTAVSTVPLLRLSIIRLHIALPGFCIAAVQCRYRQNREYIIMCVVFAMLVMPRHVLMPFWLAELDKQRRLAPAGILKLSAASATTFLLLTFR